MIVAMVLIAVAWILCLMGIWALLAGVENPYIEEESR